MLCPKCGKELKDGVKFCSGCGSSVGTMPLILEEKRNAEEDVRRYRKIGMFAVGGFALLIVLLLRLAVVSLRTPGFERPIRYFLEGIEDTDAKEMLKGMPEIYWSLQEEADWTKEEWIEHVQEELEEKRDGIRLRLSYEVTGKKKLDSERREFYEERMEDYGLDETQITEAYELKLRITVESKDSYNAKDFEEDFSLGGTIRGNSVKLSVLVGKVDGQWGILGGLMY